MLGFLFLAMLGAGFAISSFDAVDDGADQPSDPGPTTPPAPNPGDDGATQFGATSGDDILSVAGFGNTIDGLAGDDEIAVLDDAAGFGGAGDDAITVIRGGAGHGGAGADTLSVASGEDQSDYDYGNGPGALYALYGDEGDDVVHLDFGPELANTRADTLIGYGGAGDDALSLATHATGSLYGEDGDDTLVASADWVGANWTSAGGEVTLDGGDGDDEILALTSSMSGDVFGDTDFTIRGGAGDDHIKLEEHPESYVSNTYDVTLGEGEDTISIETYTKSELRGAASGVDPMDTVINDFNVDEDVLVFSTEHVGNGSTVTTTYDQDLGGLIVEFFAEGNSALKNVSHGFSRVLLMGVTDLPESAVSVV